MQTPERLIREFDYWRSGVGFEGETGEDDGEIDVERSPLVLLRGFDLRDFRARLATALERAPPPVPIPAPATFRELRSPNPPGKRGRKAPREPQNPPRGAVFRREQRETALELGIEPVSLERSHWRACGERERESKRLGSGLVQRTFSRWW